MLFLFLQLLDPHIFFLKNRNLKNKLSVRFLIYFKNKYQHLLVGSYYLSSAY